MASSAEKSTIVRSKRPGPQQRQTARLRRVFGVLERVAPRLAVRAAWNLWSQPTRPDSLAVARSREGGTGEVRKVRIELPDWTGRRPTGRDGTPKPPQTTDIAVELLGPRHGPVVYLLHGWSGWRGQLAPIGRALAASGYRAVLIDAPNHGDSGPGGMGPKHGLLPDFSLALEAIAREFGPAHAVVGHSLGGACSAIAVLDGVKADRAVFLASPVDPVTYTRTMAGMLGFSERTRARMVADSERRIGISLTTYVLPPLLAGRTDLPPALIVHDRDDPVVPLDTGRTLAKAWPGARFIETSGLGHNRILRDDAVVATVAEFIMGTGVDSAERQGCGVNGAAAAG